MSDSHPNDLSADERYEAGMAVRREVLGDAHVDRAEAAKTPFTASVRETATWKVHQPGVFSTATCRQ